MAIQIDLLPQYVGLRRKVKAAAIFMFIVYVIAGTAFTLVWYQKTLEVQTAKANVELYKAPAAETTKIAGEASAKLASLAPKQTTVDFFAAASQTGPRRAAVIDMLKMYINADSLVSAIDISDGKTVLITASIKDTDDYGNLLLNLRKGFIITIRNRRLLRFLILSQLPAALKAILCRNHLCRRSYDLENLSLERFHWT